MSNSGNLPAAYGQGIASGLSLGYFFTWLFGDIVVYPIAATALFFLFVSYYYEKTRGD